MAKRDEMNCQRLNTSYLWVRHATAPAGIDWNRESPHELLLPGRNATFQLALLISLPRPLHASTYSDCSHRAGRVPTC